MSLPELIQPNWPAPKPVQAAATTRRGGVSTGPFASLNLGDHVGDDPLAVAENRRRLGACLSAEPAWLTQVHGCQVANIDQDFSVQADAATTRRAGRACAIMTADCLPVLFCDQDGQVVAAAHAGWRGLAAGVLERTVAAMAVSPARILAWMGPAIGPDAFEVGDEVRAAFCEPDSGAAEAFSRNSRGRWMADIYQLARRRLVQAGVESIFGGDRCTHSEPDTFFSYRRDGQTGRMASLIWIDPAR